MPTSLGLAPGPERSAPAGPFHAALFWEPTFHLDSEAEWGGGVGRSSLLAPSCVSSAVGHSSGFLNEAGGSLRETRSQSSALQNPQNFCAGCKVNLYESPGGSGIVGFVCGRGGSFPCWPEGLSCCSFPPTPQPVEGSLAGPSQVRPWLAPHPIPSDPAWLAAGSDK